MHAALVVGDPHYRLFDRHDWTFHFQGMGSYVLMRISDTNNHRIFEVQAKHSRWFNTNAAGMHTLAFGLPNTPVVYQVCVLYFSLMHDRAGLHSGVRRCIFVLLRSLQLYNLCVRSAHACLQALHDSDCDFICTRITLDNFIINYSLEMAHLKCTRLLELPILIKC